MTQYTSSPGEENYQYVRSLPVQDVHVVFDPFLMNVTHDYSCPVCRANHAVLNLSTGLMRPCWTCQKIGYDIIKKQPTFFSRVCTFLVSWKKQN